MTTDNMETASGILTIDLEALAKNYKLLKSTVGSSCGIAGIVKANAYGLGLKEVADTLIKQNCSKFFVANLDEALSLRKISSDIDIHVLGGLFKGAEDIYIEHNIIPVLNCLDDIERFKNINSERNNAVLHFDTGMNRLGLDSAETDKLLNDMSLINNLNLTYIMTHFACADEKDNPMTAQQADEFKRIAQYFSNTPKSLANSPAIFRNDDYHCDLARPGIALYGGNPTPETENPMHNVVDLKCRILQIREGKIGDTVGYGATRTLKKNTQIATVAIGYADGFLRSNSDKAYVYWQDQRCPVLGRVSMDLITVDISDITGQKPQIGDMIEIIGANQTIDDLANSAGTISYEIITSLGARYKRQYI